MAGLISSLMSSSKALTAHSKGLETAGKNLANINNVGYARQRVELGDLGSIKTATGTESMGVEVLALQQMRDTLIDRQVMREISSGSRLSASQRVLQSTESALGQQIDRTNDSSSIANSPQSTGGGISETLSDFFNAFESLSVSPQDIGEKQTLLQKANILAEKLNSADSRLGQVQTDVDAQIDADLEKVSNILSAIAGLNESIGMAENGRPYSAVDLRDQRQAKIEELSEFFDVNVATIPNSNGQIQITAKDSGGADVVLVDKKTVNGQITYDTTSTPKSFTFSSTPAVTLSFSSGSLKGQLDTRDGAVQTLRDELVALADQLRISVNAAYNPLSTVGQNFFTDPTPAGKLLEVNTSLTAATIKTTNTASPGANELILAVAQVANTQFSTASGDEIDGTPAMFFSSAVSEIAQTLSSTTTRLEDQQLSEEYIRTRRDEVSGVSQDEELTDLMKFQRSFQASSKYVNILDGLLDLVVNRLGNG